MPVNYSTNVGLVLSGNTHAAHVGAFQLPKNPRKRCSHNTNSTYYVGTSNPCPTPHRPKQR